MFIKLLLIVQTAYSPTENDTCDTFLTSSLPLLLPAAIRFPLSSMAQTELSQSGVQVCPPEGLLSWA